MERCGVMLLLVLVLAGCNRNLIKGEEFDTVSRSYNQMLRWNEMEKGCINYSEPALRDDCLNRARLAKDVKVTDYRVKGIDYDDKKGTAKVRLELEYYVPPSVTVRTVEDLQQWEFRKETGRVEGEERWWLMTPVPVFK